MATRLPFRLLCLLLAGLGCAQATQEKPRRWVELRSRNFTVISDAGEKQAQPVLNQFEQIRALFQNSYGARVDPGKPIVILAVKDEQSLQELAPRFWERKGQVHPAGLFRRGHEKNYVALRLDASGDYTHHLIYHEYVHLLTSLNFPRLPLWLSEGLAEFYGNTVIREKEVQVGGVNPSQLMLLRSAAPLPLRTLLEADHRSPYYNENTKASIFYAQSWALTHYLVMGDRTDAGKRLVEFVTLLTKGVEEAEARRRAFGSLARLEERLKEYIGRSNYDLGRIQAPLGAGDVAPRPRYLSPAESAALRGDFRLNLGQPEEARVLLEEAVRLNPRLAAPHESLGFLHYQRDEHEQAARWLERAVRLNSRSYLAHYYHAMLTARRGENTAPVENHLRRTIQLNPNFAPAYSALAGQYAMQEERLAEALTLADKAAQLEPGEPIHRLNVANVVLRMGHTEEAERIGEQALGMSRSPEDRTAAQSFLNSLKRYPRAPDRDNDGDAPKRKPARRTQVEARRGTITLPHVEGPEPVLGSPPSAGAGPFHVPAAPIR